MSNTNRPNILEWFKQNYPKEYDLATEVNQRMDRILGHTEIPNPNFVIEPVKLEVIRNQQDNTKLQLVANDYGLIYIGTIVKAILAIYTIWRTFSISNRKRNFRQEDKRGHYSILCHTDIEEMPELSK